MVAKHQTICPDTWAHPSAPLPPVHCPPRCLYLRSLLVSDLSCLGSLQLKKGGLSIQDTGFYNPSPPTINPHLMTRTDKTQLGPGARRHVCFYSTAWDPFLLLGFFCPWMMHRWAYLCGRRMEADSIERPHAASLEHSDGAGLIHVLQQAVDIQKGSGAMSRLLLFFWRKFRQIYRETFFL